MLENVSDNHLNMILDAAAEKYKRMQGQNVPDPMVKPEDLKKDFPPTPAGEAPDLTPEEVQANEAAQSSNINRNPAGIVDSIKSGADWLTKPAIEPFKNLYNSVTGNDAAVVAPGATSDQVVNTAPDANTVPSPKIGVEKIGSIKQQSVPELAPSEELKKAASIVGNEKDINYSDAQKLAKDTANAELSAANEAKQTGEAIVGQIPVMQQRQQEIYNKIDAQTEKINQMTKIDPNRIWNNGSVGNKIAFLVSAGFGGLQKGGALDNLIQNDLAAQVKDAEIGSENDRGVLQVFLKQGDTMREAIQNAMSYYPHLIKAQHDAAIAGVNSSDPAINIAATNSYNATQKMKFDQSAKIAEIEQTRQKTNAGIKKENATFAQAADKSRVEAGKYQSEQLKPTPAAGAAAQQALEAKREVGNMYNIETKGHKGFDPGSLTDKAEFRALANEDLSSGVFNNKINDMVNKFFPEVKDAATKSDIASYYSSALRAAESKAKNSGSRLSKDNINVYLKDVVPPSGISKQDLGKWQLRRSQSVSNMALPGGAAALKIINQNK